MKKHQIFRHISNFLFQVYPGIILGNGETIQNVEYLRKIGVTHVLNTAERHVPVNPAKYPLHGISYFGFHVDDHPMSNLSRFFGRTTDFIEEAMNRSGLIGNYKLMFLACHQPIGYC